jgi:hypothetical protein
MKRIGWDYIEINEVAAVKFNESIPELAKKTMLTLIQHFKEVLKIKLATEI